MIMDMHQTTFMLMQRNLCRFLLCLFENLDGIFMYRFSRRFTHLQSLKKSAERKDKKNSLIPQIAILGRGKIKLNIQLIDLI